MRLSFAAGAGGDVQTRPAAWPRRGTVTSPAGIQPSLHGRVGRGAGFHGRLASETLDRPHQAGRHQGDAVHVRQSALGLLSVDLASMKGRGSAGTVAPMPASAGSGAIVPFRGSRSRYIDPARARRLRADLHSCSLHYRTELEDRQVHGRYRVAPQ